MTRVLSSLCLGVAVLLLTTARVSNQSADHLRPRILRSTFLGGSDFDWASSVTIDSQNNVYVAGQTQGVHFPTLAPLMKAPDSPTPFPYGFLTKLNAPGAVVYSTYLQATALAVAVDAADDLYVSGSGYVAKVKNDGSGFVYFTALSVSAVGLAVDRFGNAFVAGNAGASFQPLNAVQPTPGGGGDACGR